MWLKAAVLVVAALAALGWFYRAPLYGYAETGAAVGARTACSCRYVAGRTLKDCKKDFEPKMEAVFLSDDHASKSVTGYVPLIASETARYRKGYGCVLDPWRE
ncbi:MAG TPA: hypothetical protein VIC34_12300 [Croceibacterium sp.]|jgi:hypothetical protein